MPRAAEALRQLTDATPQSPNTSRVSHPCSINSCVRNQQIRHDGRLLVSDCLPSLSTELNSMKCSHLQQYNLNETLLNNKSSNCMVTKVFPSCNRCKYISERNSSHFVHVPSSEFNHSCPVHHLQKNHFSTPVSHIYGGSIAQTSIDTCQSTGQSYERQSCSFTGTESAPANMLKTYRNHHPAQEKKQCCSEQNVNVIVPCLCSTQLNTQTTNRE